MKESINYDEIAKGWIEILEERDLYTEEENMTVLRFGMIPHEPFQLLMKMLFENISKKLVETGAKYEGLEWKDVFNALKKEWKAEVEGKMARAIYSNVKGMVI